MKPRVVFLFSFLGLLILSDFYTLKVIKNLFKEKIAAVSRFNTYYWLFKLLFWTLFISLYLQNKQSGFRIGIIITFIALYAGQMILLPFAIFEDIKKLIRGIPLRKTAKKLPETELKFADEPIPRSQFLSKTGIGIGSLVFLGIVGKNSSTLYDYRVRKVHLHLPNLPSAFEGMQIAQISDIHSGGLFNPVAVRKGVDMVLDQKPELILFTGDLVDSRSDEMKDYISIFSRLKAPLGVFSVLGNHDYGEYAHWDTFEKQRKDHEILIQIHKQMGYDLLLNENRKIKIGGDEISLIGVENWSASPDYPRHGRLDLAVRGTQNSPVRLLMSHDPSHWRAEILPKYPEIDMTFSGHTHGMQMGIRLPPFQWSPIQYIFPEWAGLYEHQGKQIYVNVGFGYIGYPGRIGMYPEITIFSLSSKNG